MYKNHRFINEKIDQLKERIKYLENEADIILEKYEIESKKRRKNNLSLGIYCCDDEQALQMVKMDQQEKSIDTEIERLRIEIKAIELVDWKEYCIAEHSKFENNRYMITYDNQYNNRIYTNDYSECERYIDLGLGNNKNIFVCEYIDYNNTVDRTVNSPQLATLYRYEVCFWALPETKVIYKCIPHQLSYGAYYEEYRTVNGDLLQIEERGYNNQNVEIMHRIINFFGQESVWMNNSSIHDYVIINKHKEYKGITVRYNNAARKRKNDTTGDIKKIVEDTLQKLSKYKDYKYDIEYLKEFMQE